MLDSHDATLVGRDREWGLIRAFLASASAVGGSLLLTGEPGIGKTRLLDAAGELALAEGMRVIRAAGIEFESGMSFAGLNQVLLPLLTELPRLQAVHRDALNVALGFGAGPAPSRMVVANASLALMRESAAARPLLVILDDLPWLDRASADALGFVARRLGGSAVGLLGASRTGETDLFDRAGLPELELGRLDGSSARQLLDARRPSLALAVRERVLVEAQGNPLALLELAHQDDARASTSDPSPALGPGRRLHGLFASRIAALPPRTRRLLLLMALDGTGDVRVLEAATVPSAGLGDLAAAEDARLAYLDRPTHRLAFHHPLVRSAVVGRANAEDRRIAHRALADVWADQPERRAWHLAEGTIEPDESVARELETTAARILARGDAVGCVSVLTRASELSTTSQDRQRRLAAAAYIGADVTGDLGRGSQVLAGLRRGDIETEGSLLAAVAAAMVLLQGDGDIDMAHRLLAGAIDQHASGHDAGDPIMAEALYALLMVCSYGGDAALWRSFEDALAATGRIPMTLELNSRIFADPVHAGLAALGSLEAAITGLADETDPTQVIRVATAATYADRLEPCREPLWRIVVDARQEGAVASGITAMVMLAYDDLSTGAWDEAWGLMDEAIRMCDEHGYLIPTYSARFVQAVIAAARGDGRATELSDALLGWAGPRGVLGVQWLARQARGLVALGRGDFEGAYQEVTRICGAGQLPRYVSHAIRVLLDLVDAALHTGRDAEARAHVEAMRASSLADLSPRLALVVGGCAAMVASDDAMGASFEEALALPHVERWPFDLARVRLAYGERLRRQRAMSEARRQLEAALDGFERLGARPWSDRATTELRATGRIKPRAGDVVLDRLTPQEFEVATLAASGLTNRQIGERLFLSHRTVGGHLHRAFPKVGVATRAALRDALDSLPPERLPRDA